MVKHQKYVVMIGGDIGVNGSALKPERIAYHLNTLEKYNKQQAETIEQLTELMLVPREQAGLLQEAIIRCDSKQDIKSRVVFIIEMINKKVTEINKLEAGEL